jgi:hypothetical protein
VRVRAERLLDGLDLVFLGFGQPQQPDDAAVRDRGHIRRDEVKLPETA